VASFDSFGNMGKYEKMIVILREVGCAFGGGGGVIQYFCLFQESKAEYSSSSSVTSYARTATELSGPSVFPYL